MSEKFDLWGGGGGGLRSIEMLLSSLLFNSVYIV